VTVSNKSIEDKLDRVFTEKFGCSADKVEMMREHRFLSSEIGFSAANLLELFIEVEKEFGIIFSKDEILSTQFDDYTELVEGINKKLGGE
jgi:acyl carrier protein